MSDEKDGGNSGGWFPNINHLLLVFLAGTLLIVQKPFHELRPDKTDSTTPPIVHAVNSRLWEDPFEEVGKYIKAHDKPENFDKLDSIQDAIDKKITANSATPINVVAVMLPSDDYYEESETRRRLRYAVLSGFDAALRYMPEDTDKIQFFFHKPTEKSTDCPLPDSTKDLSNCSRVVYEWLVYKPTLHNKPTDDGERHYERPPVLLLWLNKDDFKVTPHGNLKALIKNLDNKKSQIGNVAILGPYDSDGLQDLFDEMSGNDKSEAKEETPPFSYYSPRATMRDSNLLKQSEFHYLHDYFNSNEHGGLSFLRVTATDEYLAKTIKNELKLRGIEASKQNRILLVGEWDSLYTWHLTNTFADELLHERDTDCKDKDANKPQDFDSLYEDSEQCIFRIGYLRGLDGKKQSAGDANKKAERKNTSETKAEAAAEDIESASGDSQFDYVRRMAAQIAELDEKIRTMGDAHAIKAIGILGSDVYDKLLIAEALRSKFPDAVFFTNGMDARLLEPKSNAQARNIIVASSFGLQLDRQLQRDIPPFRDHSQTAYFLATEMALTKQFQTTDFLKFERKVTRPLLISNQNELNDLLIPNNQTEVFEIGRTKSFDLSASCNVKSGEENLCLHPNIEKKSWGNWTLIPLIMIVCVVLLAVPITRQFIGQNSGLQFIISITIICFVLFISSIIRHFINPNYSNFISFFLVPAMTLFYIFLICRIASKELLRQPFMKNLSNNKNLQLSLVVIALSCCMIWFLVRPLGPLDEGEPYALVEGVSMWSSEAIRFAAFILASYFIVEVFYFPKEFSNWLTVHFHLEPTSSTVFNVHIVLDDWLNWSEFNPRFYYLRYALIAYVAASSIFIFFGFPHIPYRGESLYLLDSMLMKGLLIPAFFMLLFLVTDAVQTTIKLIGICFPDDFDKIAKWPVLTREKYADELGIEKLESSKITEWVGMRFVVELTKRIYKIISYPLIIAVLIILARSSYFDNWQMPIAIKVIMSLSIAWLVYLDFCLKKAANNARDNALKSLRTKVIKYKGEKTSTLPSIDKSEWSEKFEKLICLIESYDETVYKNFTQRPVFVYCLLIMLALLTDSADIFGLVSKFL